MKFNLLKNKKILIVAAHPDDELLGLGGSIHKSINEDKCLVDALIMSKGIVSRGKTDIIKKISIQEKSIKKASKILGINNIDLEDFPDNKFDTVALLDIVQRIENKIKRFNPDVIMTHHEKDLNIDHQIVSKAVVTATRPLPESKSALILTFETPSSTEWQVQDPQNSFFPNFYNQISKKNLIAKQKAIKSYLSEYRPYPHPRSTRSLEAFARRWGSVIGVEFAEVFRVIRIISKK